jgi:DNA-binding LacI/PurR family transcriptional regulator
MQGFADALVNHHIDLEQIIIWEGGGNDPDSGRHAALDMLERDPEITALLCFSDQLAIGASQAGLRLGRRLPDELSIVGFDDIPRAATWDPPLTTVRQPLVDKGRVAAELLMEQIADGGSRRIEVPIQLVVRASTAPLSDV